MRSSIICKVLVMVPKSHIYFSLNVVGNGSLYPVCFVFPMNLACKRQTLKRSKFRVNPTQAISPFEALGKTSSVTAPIVTWPTLRKQSIVQAKEVYSKCLLGINLVNRGQAWLKIAETSGYILSLIYIYSIWSLYQEFFLFVKTTEHLTNDHEKVIFLHKQIGYF